MTEVNVDQRQAMKKQQAAMALADNNLAAECGIIAVVVPAPAAKLAFGVGSGLFWLLANYRQQLANDPPRDDFTETWVTTAELDESLLPDGTDDERSIYRLAAQLMLVADASFALLRSLERYDGAVSAEDFEAANEQANAAGFNARAMADRQDALAAVARQANEAFATLVGDSDLTGVSLDAAQQFYRENVADSPQAVIPGLGAVTGGASDLLEPFTETGLTHSVLETDALPSPTPELFDIAFFQSLTESSETLRILVNDGNA